MRPNPEQSFLNSQRKLGMKKRGRPTKESIVLKALEANSSAFFATKIINDDTEAKLWRMFITGLAEQVDAHGTPVRDAEGRAFLIEVELSPVSLKAFLQAVAYKRGTPRINVEGDSKGGNIQINYNVLGAPSTFFQEQVEQMGKIKTIESKGLNPKV